MDQRVNNIFYSAGVTPRRTVEQFIRFVDDQHHSSFYVDNLDSVLCIRIDNPSQLVEALETLINH